VIRPILYKGLALFTPGQDVVFCRDSTKQGHWHQDLCHALQQLLDLREPPLFLVPCYSAAVDYWFDEEQQLLRVAAEVYPLAWPHRPLLDALFALPDQKTLLWQLVEDPQHPCDRLAIESYRADFPQLWEHHHLVYDLRQVSPASSFIPRRTEPDRYVLRLYVASETSAVEHALKNLHALLSQCLTVPYTLKVVDVTKQPEFAEEDQVTATPTLVRVHPRPVRRLVGHLDDRDRVQRLLTP
jgi:circadian clock protein KaiB